MEAAWPDPGNSTTSKFLMPREGLSSYVDPGSDRCDGYNHGKSLQRVWRQARSLPCLSRPLPGRLAARAHCAAGDDVVTRRRDLRALCRYHRPFSFQPRTRALSSVSQRSAGDEAASPSAASPANLSSGASWSRRIAMIPVSSATSSTRSRTRLMTARRALSVLRRDSSRGGFVSVAPTGSSSCRRASTSQAVASETGQYLLCVFPFPG